MAWVPLESNPEVMTKFLHNLGVSEKWNIVDVYGLDPELLAIVPRPVLAVIFLYPDSAKFHAPSEKGDSSDDTKTLPEDVYHVKQCITNACGAIALIHSVANNVDKIDLSNGFLKTFLDESKDLSFDERGERLVNAQGIIDIHREFAQEGQTEAPAENASVSHHFVAFVHKNGSLYELDGRKPSPINHGPTKPDELLENAARICKEYMTRDAEEVRFTIVALTASD